MALPETHGSDFRPLTERLRPRSLHEIVGNARALADLRDWATGWAATEAVPVKRAALLEGPAGVGKTTAALALAAELGWTVVEMNASDARNQGAIDAVAGRAALTNTLGSYGVYRGRREGARSLILLDEADCLSGRAVEETRQAKSVVSFRDFLRSRYVRVEDLSKAWGLERSGPSARFERWDDVPATAGRGAWTRLPAAQRDILEWKQSQRPPDNSDRGGLAAIARLVRETRQPVALTVNDPQSLTRYSPLFRTGVARVRFEPLRPTEVKTLVRRAALKEHIPLAGHTLDRIVERSDGDARAALNDLEAVGSLPEGLDPDPLLGGRDLPSDFFGVTSDVLAHPRFYRSVEISNRLDSTPDDLLPWVEESVARRAVDPEARAAAFDHVARADLFLNRARRQRVYSLWSYATETMTGGTSLALAGSMGRSSGTIAFPEFLGAMGRTRFLRALQQALLTKAGRRFHVSRRKGVEVLLPFLTWVFASGPTAAGRAAMQRQISQELELTAEELGFLLNREPDHPDVRRLLSRSPKEPPEDEDEPSAEETAPSSSRSARGQRRLAEF